MPLVFETNSWQHGVLVGAAMASETTAAAAGAVGVVRRDPMAMKPFCGYNFADYLNHWLTIAGSAENLPGIYHVNWFRKDPQGRFMWPGFGDNMRVLEWVINRCRGQAGGHETKIGVVPSADDLNLAGLEIDPATMAALLEVDEAGWRAEIEQIGEYLASYGERIPQPMLNEYKTISGKLA